MNLQKKATLIASASAFFLALLKFIIALMSGSVAILTSAVDSMIDFIISVFNFLALKKSSQEANQNYNFGFNKIEALMGLVEGFFIAGIGVFIFLQGLSKIYYKEEIKDLDLGIFVMVFSLIATFALVIFLNFVAKKTQSLIVQSDCLHYKSDFLMNFCTLAALIVIYFTQFYFIDGIFGIILSFYIVFSAVKIIKKSLEFLMDMALESFKVEKICNLIKENKEVLSFHELKTRKSPNLNYLSVHLVFSPMISLLKAHQVADTIEAQIRKMFDTEKWDIQIHLDPYDDEEEERKRK